MSEYEEEKLNELIDAGEISPEEVAEIVREDRCCVELWKEECGEGEE